jgi:hypothetical protein
MALLTLQSIAPTGLGPTYAAATASDTASGISADDRVFIHAKNSNAATATVTINAVAPTSVKVPGVGNVAVPALAVTIPATTGDRMIGPIPPAYIDGTGTITMLNTGTITNLTLAVVRLPATSQQ